jgi:hypothetical protein
VVTATSELKPTAHQDGGNSGDTKVLTLSMKEERSLTSLDPKMRRTEISSPGTNILDLTNNGTSFMLMNIQKSQRRENSIKTLVSMLRDHSTLSHNFLQTDILI